MKPNKYTAPENPQLKAYKFTKLLLSQQTSFENEHQHSWLIGLNDLGEYLFTKKIAIGEDRCRRINPVFVFRQAIRYGATKLIIVQNHPVHLPNKFDFDLIATDYLIKVGQFLEIEVIDHLIVSEYNYISLKRKGIIKSLRDEGFCELMKMKIDRSQ